ILRPRIVIPAQLDLADNEMAAILDHECAHIRRRDNFLALVEALLGAALWFHPLVWMARRILARAREEACDEIVVTRGDAGTYLAALAKVCRAAAAPRVAGVSCIVSNTIRERMNAIMTLPLRRSLPHRFVVAVAVALLAAVTLVHAKDGKSRYSMSSTVNATGDQYTFDITVRDNTSGAIVAHPIVKTAAGATAEATVDGVPKFDIRVTVEKEGHAEVVLKVIDRDGNVVDGLRTVITINKQPGPGITLKLENADLKDVIRSFGQISGMDVQIDPDVEGTVSVDVHDTPWDKALQRILADNHCEYETDGKTMHVRRIR
ncbi:MAG TPA: M56 family metallopeptidase, partial [Thermoanaerobaculia bacterium]|nr:M56 family metallopeptidase [Thermoanaerobaculia bacterium]